MLANGYISLFVSIFRFGTMVGQPRTIGTLEIMPPFERRT
nr:MAG TPA: hypothetical protein [Caudoviricetes sp.]